MAKILMYGWEFPPYISGGLGIACHDLTKALTELNEEITFVLPSLKKNKDFETHVDLIDSSNVEFSIKETFENEYENFLTKHNIIKIDSTLRPYHTEKSYLEFLERLYSSEKFSESVDIEARAHKLEISGNYGGDLKDEVFRYAFVAGIIAKRIEHDIIHAHDWLTILAGVEAKKHSGKPLIYHVHALETDRSGKDARNDIYDIERQGMLAADKIIAVSYLTKNSIVKYYGIDPLKIEVVHNAVSKAKSPQRLNNLRKKPEEKIVLFLGRLTYQKGPDYFLEAAAEVIKLDPNIRFVFAGSGDMITRLINRTAQLRLGKNVHFTGFLKRPEVEELFASSDAYIMSSVSEPFGISCLEAILFDVPTIISKQSGVSEVLSSALKVDFWDTKELANKILSVLKYSALQNELKSRAALELKEIQWERSAKHVQDIYNNMLISS
jgi:glycosyltransferase involved in cell wall biosynthesis